jgi:hypothetical protein
LFLQTRTAMLPTMLDWNQCPTVERVPGKVSGVWLFRGTRVPVSRVLADLMKVAVSNHLICAPCLKDMLSTTRFCSLIR